jgi:glycosyltransferase involved in cell wall biosynthesis
VRILIATVQIPFVRGGAEVHAEGLRDALRASGHEAEIVAIPFRWYPPERVVEHILACRLLDLTEFTGIKTDMLIGLKFPAYLIPHPNKVIWILHQHRQAYDLWNNTSLGDLVNFPDGAQARDAIRHADTQLIPEARAVYANSMNVAARLKKYCGIDSTPLYHPPQNAAQFHCLDAEDYLFFPSRLSAGKRQELVLEALAETRQPVRVCFAGSADDPTYARTLKELSAKLKVERRVVWLGHVSEKKKRDMYARALGVVYAPWDEDYGYVTLEAMLASKPVITCTDSGGTLEFVCDGETGLIAEPNAVALARAMDALWQNRRRAKKWGRAGRQRYESLGISWENVVRTLLRQDADR